MKGIIASLLSPSGFNIMANVILKFGAGNGNRLQPSNCERKLLIGRKHTFHRLRKCYSVFQYNLISFFKSGLWRELLVSLKIYFREKFHRGGEGAQIFFINWYKDSECVVESGKKTKLAYIGPKKPKKDREKRQCLQHRFP